MFFKHIIKIIAPNTCLGCGRADDLLCSACLPMMSIRKAETCFRCNRLSPNYRTCVACRRHTKLRRVVVASQYEGAIKELVHRLKYDNAVDAAAPLAQLIAVRIQEIDRYDLLVPVPTSARRRRQRGYNQAVLLAKLLSKDRSIPYIDLLFRRGVAHQVGTGREARLKQLEGAIYLSSPKRVAGMRILLVDDVVTTGGTLSECARVLKKAGAKTIDAVVVAKH